jgi:hypothetical protein
MTEVGSKSPMIKGNKSAIASFANRCSDAVSLGQSSVIRKRRPGSANAILHSPSMPRVEPLVKSSFHMDNRKQNGRHCSVAQIQDVIHPGVCSLQVGEAISCRMAKPLISLSTRMADIRTILSVKLQRELAAMLLNCGERDCVVSVEGRRVRFSDNEGKLRVGQVIAWPRVPATRPPL